MPLWRAAHAETASAPVVSVRHCSAAKNSRRLASQLELLGIEVTTRPSSVDAVFAYCGDGKWEEFALRFDELRRSNVIIIGGMPWRLALSKADECQIAERHVTSGGRRYSLPCTSRVGSALPGRTFVWRPLDRQGSRNDVAAGGSGMRFTTNNTLTAPGLLMGFNDEPLMQHGTFRGRPEATRTEVRLIGAVQWRPRRTVWLSHFGMTRCGSPVRAADHRSRWVLNPAPVIDSEGCADFLPEASGPGFQTAGGLDLMERIARENGLDVARVWEHLDGAVTSYVLAHAHLVDRRVDASWWSPFNADIGMRSDGSAVVYEMHYAPPYKSPGHNRAAIDTSIALGAYGVLALPLLCVRRRGDERTERTRSCAASLGVRRIDPRADAEGDSPRPWERERALIRLLRPSMHRIAAVYNVSRRGRGCARHAGDGAKQPAAESARTV